MCHIFFELVALCKKVLKLSSEFTSITAYDKKKGDFNRCSGLAKNNAGRVEARLFFTIGAIVGLARLTTNSENVS